MSYIHIISGSPSAYSSAAAVEDYIGRQLRRSGVTLSATVVRQLPATALMQQEADNHGVLSSVALLEQAQGVVIVAPVVKAACGGIVKCYLDLLPADIFAGKFVLPVVVGAPGCRLVLEYGLRPILSALSADIVLPGVFAAENDVCISHGGTAELEDRLATKLDTACQRLTSECALLFAKQYEGDWQI